MCKVLQDLAIDERPLSCPPAYKAKGQVFRRPARIAMASSLDLQTPLTMRWTDEMQFRALSLLGGRQILFLEQPGKIVSCNTILEDALNAIFEFRFAMHDVPFSTRGRPRRFEKVYKGL